MRFLPLLFLFCASLPAQILNFGVKGGFPFNDAVKAAGNFHSEFQRWTAGPMVDLNLPFGLGIEANMLYRSTGYSNSTSHTAGSFEFPLLVKYKFPGKLARMYVDSGFSFRHVGDIPQLMNSNSKGFVVGAGIRFDVKLFKISPELRYTRWGNDIFAMPDLSSARNQTEFLIGITF